MITHKTLYTLPLVGARRPSFTTNENNKQLNMPLDLLTKIQLPKNA